MIECGHKPTKSTLAALERLEDAMADEKLTFREACALAKINYRTAYRYHGPAGRRGGGRTIPPLTKEAAIEAFKDACAELGMDRPTSHAYTAAAPPQVSHMTLYRLFGSWDAVLEAAGMEPIRWQSRGLPAKMKLTNDELEARGIV